MQYQVPVPVTLVFDSAIVLIYLSLEEMFCQMRSLWFDIFPV